MSSVIMKKSMINGKGLIKDTQINCPRLIYVQGKSFWIQMVKKKKKNMQAREILTFYAGFFKRINSF